METQTIKTEDTTAVATTEQATTSTAETKAPEAVPAMAAAAAAGPKPSVGLMGLAEVAFAVEAQASPKPANAGAMEVDRDNNNGSDKVCIKDRTRGDCILNPTFCLPPTQTLSLQQIRKMPDKTLLTTFAEYTKRGKHLSYKCQFETTDGQPCQQVFDTAGGGDRVSIARPMTTHLKSHLTTLEKISPDIKIEPKSPKLKQKKRPLKKKTTTASTPSTTTTTPSTTLAVDGVVVGATIAAAATTTNATDNITRTASPLPSVMVMPTPTTPVTEKKGSTATPITVVLAKKTPVKGNANDKNEVPKTLLGMQPTATTQQQQPPTLPVTKPINIVAAAMDAANIFGTQDDNKHMTNLTSGNVNNSNEIVVSSTIIVQPPPSQAYGAMIPVQSIKQEDVKPQHVVANHPILIPGMTPFLAPVVIEDSSGDVKIEPSSSSGSCIPSSSKTATATENAVPAVEEDPETAKVRAQALEYIDDIRKKSSSAAKSVIVNGDKSLIYECKLCPDKQFTSTNGLIFHYKKHAGLKPYICELCSATFTRQHSLNYHMLIHYNKSRFVCKECGRHFRHPSHFKEHMRRHTGETPFQCSDCLIR